MENRPPPPMRRYKRNQSSVGQVQPSLRTFFPPRPHYTPPPLSPDSPIPDYKNPLSPASAKAALPLFQPTHSAHPIQILSPGQAVPIEELEQEEEEEEDEQIQANPPQEDAASSTLPEQASIVRIEEDHIQPLRRINSLLLPIHYPDTFYHKILSPDPTAPSTIKLSRAILWTQPPPDSSQKVIGGLICRLDPALHPSSTPSNPLPIPDSYEIYIQSLALLSPYRGKGLVTQVLKDVIRDATKQRELRIESLYAHVWTENEEALHWYLARGFKKEDGILQGYYRRLNPDTAWILRRPLLPSDHLSDHPLQAQQSILLQPKPIQTNPPPTPQKPVVAIPPPPTSATKEKSRPPAPVSARSFQNAGPDREWNDLPEDVLLKLPGSGTQSRERSATTSRSSSTNGLTTEKEREKGGKKKRVYPAAAFGV